MSTESMAVATKAWETWMAGDIEGFLATLADDGVMTMPGDSVLSGAFHGPAEVGAWAKNLFERSGGTIDAKVEVFGDAGDGVVLASMWAKASREGRTLDQRMLQRFEIRDGRVARLDHALMDVDGWHDFWA